MLKVAIVIGSTRPGRYDEAVAQLGLSHCSRKSGSRRRTNQALQLFVRRMLDEKRLPVADRPNIDVHEVGAAVVTHSTAMQAQGRIAQFRGRNPR